MSNRRLASSPLIDSDDKGQCLQPRPPRIYINDDMTQIRAEIAAAARASKKKGKVTDTWVRDGVVFVKTGDTVHRVTTRRMLGVVLKA
ncbi:hypothetical protein ACOMHN_060593 [Nucella lapillus]